MLFSRKYFTAGLPESNNEASAVGRGWAMEVSASAHGEVVIRGIEFDEEHGDGAFDTGVLGEKTLTAAAEREESFEVPHDEGLLEEGILSTGLDGGFGRRIPELERAFW
jgi:hypothetical protein